MGKHIEILTGAWPGKTMMLLAVRLMVLSIFCSNYVN